METRSCLRLYGWVFAGSGILFVLAGAGLFDAAGPGAWLALTGSMMAMIAFLAFTLAREPARPVAWKALLLSKATSTLLFAAFAAAQRNPWFLLGAAVDGPILLHLASLRQRAERERGPMAARFSGADGPFYEVWFAKFNDPASRRALWLRYEAVRRAAGGGEATCAWVLFEPDGKPQSGSWTEALAEASWGERTPFRVGRSAVEAGRLTGSIPGADWDFAWSERPSPVFRFVPDLLALTGLAASEYATPVSWGTFGGTLRLPDREVVFREAPGCLGHLWGRNMPDNWRWAHAVVDGNAGEEPAVFEILSAQVRVGPWRAPRLTCAHLWMDGAHHASASVIGAFRNSTEGLPGRWTFRADFGGGLVATGECVPGASAELEYASPDGRRLLCRNSKTGRIALAIGGKTLTSGDAAAVEWAETAG